MRILRITLTPYALAFNRPLQTAVGVVRERTGVIVALADEAGAWGYGDSAPLPGFSHESAADVLHELEMFTASLSHVPDVADALLAPPFDTLSPSARSGLEQAVLDLQSRRAGVSMAHWLVGDAARTQVPVHALVRDVEDAQRALDDDHKVLKIKVGRTLEKDAARVLAIRHAVGPDIDLRLDANGAWSTPDEALQALERFAQASPHSLEQPLPASAPLEAWRRVLEHAPFALAMDESIRTPTDLDTLLESGLPVAAVVLKPMFCGGVLTTLKMAKRAHAAGLALSVTTALESGVGRQAALQLSAMVPGDLWSCGLDTGRLLATDILTTLRPKGAFMSLSCVAEVDEGLAAWRGGCA